MLLDAILLCLTAVFFLVSVALVAAFTRLAGETP